MTTLAFFGLSTRSMMVIITLSVTLFFSSRPAAWFRREVPVDAGIRAALDTVFDPNDRAIRAEAEEKLETIEAELKGTFNSLPKNTQGRLAPRAVRHMVATYFGKEHGLYIKGLEPHGMQRASCKALHEVSILRDRAPDFARALVEARQTERGLSLKELVTVVVVLENLIIDDHQGVLEVAYDSVNVSIHDKLKKRTMRTVLNHYVLALWHGNVHNFSNQTVLQELLNTAKGGSQWKEIDDFTRESMDKPAYYNRDLTNPFVPRMFDFQAASRVLRDMARVYGKWQDESCVKMKKDLIKLDPNASGRIPLLSFYTSSLTSAHSFTESEAYLEHTGALDKTTPDSPKVIITNYINGPSNCVSSFPYYSICCLRECDVLMAQIEGQIQAPSADPDELLSIARNLSTPTIKPPRRFAKKLVAKLWAIAESHGGEVPVHGRLFAQWMHYAFPWECPYPQVVSQPAALTMKFWDGAVKMATTEDLQAHHKTTREKGAPDACAPSMKQWTDDEVLPIHELEAQGFSAGALDLGSLRWACRLAGQVAACLATLSLLRAGLQVLRQAWQPASQENDVGKLSRKAVKRSRREAEHLKRKQSKSMPSSSTQASMPDASCACTEAEGGGPVDATSTIAAREPCAYCGHDGWESKYVSTLCVSGCMTYCHKACWRQKHGGFKQESAPRQCTCGELLERIEVYEYSGDTDAARLVHTIQSGVLEEAAKLEPEVTTPAVGKRKKTVRRQADAPVEPGAPPAGPPVAAPAAPSAPRQAEDLAGEPSNSDTTVESATDPAAHTAEPEVKPAQNCPEESVIRLVDTEVDVQDMPKSAKQTVSAASSSSKPVAVKHSLQPEVDVQDPPKHAKQTAVASSSTKPVAVKHSPQLEVDASDMPKSTKRTAAATSSSSSKPVAAKHSTQPEVVVTGKLKPQNLSKKQSPGTADGTSARSKPLLQWSTGPSKQMQQPGSWSAKLGTPWFWTQQPLKAEPTRISKRDQETAQHIQQPGQQNKESEVLMVPKPVGIQPLRSAAWQAYQKCASDVSASPTREHTVSKEAAEPEGRSHRGFLAEIRKFMLPPAPQISMSETKSYVLPPAPHVPPPPPPPPPPGLEPRHAPSHSLESVPAPPGPPPPCHGLAHVLQKPNLPDSAIRQTFRFNPPPGFEDFQSGDTEDQPKTSAANWLDDTSAASLPNVPVESSAAKWLGDDVAASSPKMANESSASAPARNRWNRRNIFEA